jgi:monoamine oxidase
MPDELRGGFTRRRFLEAVGAAGGAAAVYEVMTALGMIRIPEAFAQPPELPPGSGNGKSVVILGAGIAGLVAAYEMRKAGFTVTMLEAQDRTGGRSLTIRHGNKIVEVNAGGKRTEQTCDFDDRRELYFNAGPGRIPYHHTEALRYCRLLKVPLEVYVMASDQNFYFTPEAFLSDKPKQRRRVANDTRGYIAELLAKVVNRGTLDAELSLNDKAALLSLLASFGPLNADQYYQYKGSDRAGYAIEPGVDTPGELLSPLGLQELLKSRFWLHRFYQPEDYEWQATLFQPVDGMDKLAHALAEQVKTLISTNREVAMISTSPKGVRVGHCKSGTKCSPQDMEYTEADYCISTIPLPILRNIENNFSIKYQNAISAVEFAYTCKVGWQADRRFWEENDQMYGGISYINHNITQMWYPSAGYFTDKGILTGAYNYGVRAAYMTALSPSERKQLAAEGAALLHPEFAKHVQKEKGITIAWKNIPYQAGGWADWDPSHRSHYATLLQPEGRFWVAGDQVSYLDGWQEGAIRSAQWVMNGITKPRAAVAPLIRFAPNANAMTGGSGPVEEHDEE